MENTINPEKAKIISVEPTSTLIDRLSTEVLEDEESFRAADSPEDFMNPYFVPAAGNLNGGQKFRYTQPGQKVKTLEIWGANENDRLIGVRVTFENGAQMVAGRTKDRYYSITFHPNELITKTVIRKSNYGAGRVGNIYLETNFGQRFLGGADNSRYLEYLESTKYINLLSPIPPGLIIGKTDDLRFLESTNDTTQGLLIGVYGGAGADIDHLGIILAKPQPIEYTFENVKYNLNAFRLVTEKPISLKEQIIDNSSTTATVIQQVTFSHSSTKTRTWSNQVGLKAGVKTTIKAGIPLIVEGKIEISAEVNYAHTWGGTSTETSTDTWSASVSVPPKGRVKAVGTVTQSTIEVPYEATVTTRYSDGTIKRENGTSGVYQGVNVSRFQITVENI